jgi:hypothetical protein
MSVNTIRVAIQGAIPDEATFIVQRLKTGQPLPANTMEAMLVLTGEVHRGIEDEPPLAAERKLAWATNGRHVLSVFFTNEAWTRRSRALLHYCKRALRFFGRQNRR